MAERVKRRRERNTDPNGDHTSESPLEDNDRVRKRQRGLPVQPEPEPRAEDAGFDEALSSVKPLAKQILRIVSVWPTGASVPFDAVLKILKVVKGTRAKGRKAVRELEAAGLVRVDVGGKKGDIVALTAEEGVTVWARAAVAAEGSVAWRCLLLALPMAQARQSRIGSEGFGVSWHGDERYEALARVGLGALVADDDALAVWAASIHAAIAKHVTERPEALRLVTFERTIDAVAEYDSEAADEMRTKVSSDGSTCSLVIGLGLVDFANLAARYPAVSSLAFHPHSCGWVDDAQVAAFAHAWPSLTAVNLARCTAVTDAGIELLVASCGVSLTSLNLDACQLLSDATLETLARACPNLAVLSLDECRAMTDTGLTHLAAACPLTSLSLDRCSVFGDPTATALGQHCPALTHLNLGYAYSITDAGLAALADGCTALTSLSLESVSRITDEGVVALAEQCPALTTLNFHSNQLVGDAALAALGRHCPALAVLALPACDSVTDAGLTSLAQGCPALTEVTLGCELVTDAGVVALARSCPALTNLFLASRAHAFTDTALAALATGCPLVSELSLSSHAVTGTGLGGISTLTDLRIDSTALSDKGLVALATTPSPALTHIRFRNAELITDIGIAALAPAAPSLTYLDLSGCTAVNDAALAALATHCPALSVVSLHSCTSVTDLGLRSLVDNCSITRLNTYGIATDNSLWPAW